MESTVTVYQYIDLNYIELMAGEDELMKQLMLEMLLDELPRELDKLYEHYEYQEWDELRRVSHKLKIVFAFLGNDLLSSANRELEQLLRFRTGLEKLPELITIIQKIYPKVLEELRTEYESLEVFV